MYQSISSVLSLALLLSSTSAAPTDDQYSQLNRVPTGDQRNKNGILQIEKTYKKYGWEMPEKLSETAAAVKEKIATNQGTSQVVQKIAQQQNQGTVGSISAVPQQHNAEYLCPIVIGGQTLNLDLDTGSSDFWIFNTAISGSEQGSHSLYNPSSSKTYTAANDMSFSLSYGDKTSLKGGVAKEQVKLGGLIVDGQAIELPSDVSSGITSDNADGIMGLGFQSINSISQNSKLAPQPTFFENAMWQLSNPLFTANLKPGKSGYYKFGRIDQTAYKDGTLWYTKVDNSTGYWGFESSQYAIGGGSTQTNGNTNSMAIADTGSSLLFVNPASHDAFYANVNGKTTDQTLGQTSYPCSETLPDFHVSLGDQMATIPGFLLNYAPDSNKGPNGEDMCVGGIQSNNGKAPQVYGDILFELYFTIFDYGNMQIGFAPHA